MPELPIFQDGEFVPNPGFLVVGFMLYPGSVRSAKQMSGLLIAEARAKFYDRDYEESPLIATVMGKQALPHKWLLGRMALQMVKLRTERGITDCISKAAHLVSELHSSEKTVAGKPLPTTSRTVRENFLSFQRTAHLWGALSVLRQDRQGHPISEFDTLNQMTIDKQLLIEVLMNSIDIENCLSECLGLEYDPWSVGNEIYRHADPQKSYSFSLLENPKTDGALASYRSRSGGK